MNQKKYLTGFTIFYAILIIFLSLFPTQAFPAVKFNLIDRFLHFLEYFIFTILLILCFKNIRYFLSLGISTSYGIMVELLQLLVKYRNFSYQDIIFNILGTLAAVFTHIFIRSHLVHFLNLIRKRNEFFKSIF